MHVIPFPIDALSAFSPRRARDRAIADQVQVPYPPYEWRPEPGCDRRPRPAEPSSQSYLTHRVRLWVGGRVVELSPGSGRARPERLGLGSPLIIMGGFCPPERRSTAVDNAASLARFQDALTDLLPRHGATGRTRAAFLPESRAWVEAGEAFSGVPLAAVRDLAQAQEQRGFAVWEADGLRFEWTDGGTTPARPVRLRKVRPGCPMRFRHPQLPCVPVGGPWVEASRRAAAFWVAHHRMLTGALGSECDIDRPGVPEVIWAGTLIQPSRSGGWDVEGSTLTMGRVRPTG